MKYHDGRDGNQAKKSGLFHETTRNIVTTLSRKTEQRIAKNPGKLAESQRGATARRSRPPQT